MCFFLKKSPAHGTWAQAMASMGQAALQFEQQLDTIATGEMGALIRPVEDQTIAQTKAEIERALSGMDRTQFRTEVTVDDQGHGWALIKGSSLQELAAGAAQMGEVLLAAGLGDRVVAAVFPLKWNDPTAGKERVIYWVYQPRIRSFTPFAPDGPHANRERSTELEVRMEGAVRRLLPTARQTTEWYPIWGMPF
ncbi:MAG: hypothetical protein O3B65_03450 [Chloroflexi bacterium]|nr:hypothetical protein [Chloroflexota bacterium]